MNKERFKPGQLVGIAVLQTERKLARLAKEKEQADWDHWKSAGEWSPVDEEPDEDEL
jgi:hypothetical protein